MRILLVLEGDERSVTRELVDERKRFAVGFSIGKLTSSRGLASGSPILATGRARAGTGTITGPGPGDMQQGEEKEKVEYPL